MATPETAERPAALEPSAVTQIATQAFAPIAESHQPAWAALARAHAALTGRIQDALTDAGLPPYTWFELLSVLESSPEGKLTMGELAEALIMTRGGLTKLFDRLEAAELVSRAACPTDRRAVYAVIEGAGRKLLGQMQPIVARELEAAFVKQITAAEAQTIAAALERARNGACSME